MSAVVGYRCPKHGESTRCSVNENGERICPDCERVVSIVERDDRVPDDEQGWGRS